MGLLDLLIIIILISWLGGFSLHLAGGLIHLLLIVLVVVLIFRFKK